MPRRITLVPAAALALAVVLSAAGAGTGAAAPADAVPGPQLSPTSTPRAATAVTVGQTAAPGAPSSKCAGSADAPQDTIITPHATWKMPADGVVTSFSHQGGQVVTAGNYVRAVVLRRETSPTAGYRIVGKTTSILPVPGTLATSPTRITVRAGDVLAVSSKGVQGADACYFSYPGSTTSSKRDDIDATDFIADGSGGQVGSGAPNISVALEPDADGDGFGDVSQDGCTVDAAIQDQCPVPDTRVTKAPKKKGYARKVKVKFAASLADATFTCTVDFRAPRPCTSPFRFKVGVGKHRLLVQATSPRYGTTEVKPADIRWKVLKKKD